MKRFVFFTCIFFFLSHILSDLISICELNKYEIKCNIDEYIVIKDASFGYFQSLDLLYRNRSGWCFRKKSYFQIKFENCYKSVYNIVNSRCTGQESCHKTVLQLDYIKQNEQICQSFERHVYPMSLYVNYVCAKKELFFSPYQMNSIHYVGGYMASVGYHQKKIADKDQYFELGRSHRDLPMAIKFRPNLIGEGDITMPITYQIEIIENTISLNQSNGTNTCQIGKLYYQDYYAFIATNGTQSIDHSHNELLICPHTTNNIGQIFGPIIAKEVNITFNVDFSSMSQNVLLVKFTTIFCPPIVIENAKVVYDHIVSLDHQLSVHGVAIISCKNGFVFHSLSNASSKVYTKSVECDHLGRFWKERYEFDPCVYIPTSTVQTTQLDPNNYSETTITIFTTNGSIAIVDNKFSIGWLVFFIVIIVLVSVAAIVLWIWWTKKKYNIFDYCRKHCNTIPKRAVRDGLSNASLEDIVKRRCVHTFLHQMLKEDKNCNGGTLRPNELSAIQLSDDDELPTKEPKISTLNRIKSSASSLGHSISEKFQPMPLPRPKTTGSSSFRSDDRYSGSKNHLSTVEKTSLTSEFIDNTSSICISQNDTTQIINEVDETYLEPKLTQNNKIPPHTGDYMVYKKLDSCSIDDTLTGCTSLSTLFSNHSPDGERRKRLSMESNNYYGVTGNEDQDEPSTSMNNTNLTQSCDGLHSTECVYELIDLDDEDLYAVNRKTIPLPSPPSFC